MSRLASPSISGVSVNSAKAPLARRSATQSTAGRQLQLAQDGLGNVDDLEELQQQVPPAVPGPVHQEGGVRYSFT
jgi:hypothetical protein